MNPERKIDLGKGKKPEPINPESITPEEDEEIARRQQANPNLSRGEILRQIRLEKENQGQE